MPHDLDKQMLGVTLKTQHRAPNKTHEKDADTVTDRSIQIKMGLNKALGGGEDGTVVDLRDHNRTYPERETFYATKGGSKEAKTPGNAVKAFNNSSGRHPRVTDKLSSSSIDHDGKYSANVQANGTAKDEMHGLKAVALISPSFSSPKITQSPEPTRQSGQTDAPGPVAAQRNDAPNIEDFSNLDIIPKPIESETSQQPENIVPKDTIPKDKISSYFLDAHPVTGEPAVESTRIQKYKFFSLNRSPLKKWMPKVKEMLLVNGSKASISRIDVNEVDGLEITSNVHTTTRSKGALSGIDFDEVDGLKIATNRYATAIDNNNFESHIREKLAALICTIPPKGLEKQSSTLQELEMIVNEDNQITPCIVIACASQNRKADIKNKLDSELPHIELYGLRCVVIYDLERSGYLALSAAESNEELAPTGQPGYIATTTLAEASDINNWDRYTSAPLHLFSIFPNDEVTDAPIYASCTLGGFIQVADGIYGLTVAHPFFNAIKRSSTQAPRPHSGPNSKDFVVGNIIACVLSSVSSDNRAGKEEQGSAPPNSDWALIELGESFNKAQLDEGQLVTNLTPVEKENLEVVKDADLEPRTVMIRTGFSSDVKGKLSIAKSSLQIGSALFTVMRITLNEPLVSGDSGSFVFLDGKVCGTIIAGRDSLKRAYMIPITDTFRSISSEFGGAPVRFPEAGVIQSPSSPQQNKSSGQVTSHQKTKSPFDTKNKIPGDLEIPNLANPEPTISPSSSMPEESYKLNIHESKDKGISKSGTLSKPKTKTQPIEGNITLPHEGSSNFLPLSYDLVNNPPSMNDKFPKSVVRKPPIEVQWRNSADDLGAGRVRSVEDVKKAIKKGANVDMAETKSYEAMELRRASENGHLEVVKLLLEKGAGINTASIYEETLLHRASENGHLEVVKLLLEKGAGRSAASIFTGTPLRLASENGHLEVVKLLLEKGAGINAASIHEETPLHRASENGHLEVVKLLLEKGADINAASTYTGTPLHRASANGHLDVVKLLIKEGADINAADDKGCTPLYWAFRRGHLEVVKLLAPAQEQEKEAPIQK